MILTNICICLLTHHYFIFVIETGTSERVCKPRLGEDMGSYYSRAAEYYNLVGNAAEEARVIWLGKALRMNKGGWSIERTAAYYLEKVQRARTVAMMYSCKESFRKLRNTIANHDEVLEGKELEQYKLLGGWTTDQHWDQELKTRYEKVNKGEWVRGLPDHIQKNLKEMRERHIQIIKEEDMKREEEMKRALEE